MADKEEKYIIKTNRLELRPIRKSDLEFVFKGLSDPDVFRFYGVKITTLQEAHEQMDWYQNLLDTKTGIWWKLTSRETGLSMGACGFNNWDHSEKSAEIGVWLLPEYWGKSLMREAIEGVLSYGFKSMNLRRIIAEVEKKNIRSVGLLTSVGFVQKPEKTYSEVKDDELIEVEIFEITE